MKRDDDGQQADTFFENTASGLLESGVDSAIDASRARDRALLQCQALALQAAGLGLWEWEVPTGALIVDAHWAMTLGYAVAELEPHIDTIKRLENPEDRHSLLSSVKRCLVGEAAEFSGEHRLRHKNGHWVWLVEQGIVLERDPQGGPKRAIGTSRDVTEAKLARAVLLETQHRQALAMKSARLGQWDWNLVTDELIFDARFAEIIGYEPGELSGDTSTWTRIVHPDDRKKMQESLNAHVRGETETYSQEHRVLHKCGQVVWVHGMAVIVERDTQGSPLRIVGVHQDISAHKQSEQDLLAAKEGADSANRAKSQFLANMSHEIRTPMNAMIGLTSLVLGTELSSRQRDFLQKVHGSAKSLLRILNDILDHSKIEAGRMTLEQIQFPIEEPLNNVAGLFGAQAEQKGLEIFFEVAPDVPMEIVGDPLRLTQVLNNLVGNAVKFTERGEIRIKASVDKRVDDTTLLRFSVSDTGIGLSTDQAADLFKAFTQADNSVTRKYGGTGLGLTISRELVELMGGEMSVAGNEGEGCTFTFTVRVLAARTEKARLDIHRVRGMRALIVDDQHTSRQILGTLFDAWGLETDAVASGEEGLALIERSRELGLPYDVVLLDWRMPGMDGLEMARRMRAASPEGSCPPFAIMVTAFSHDEVMHNGRDLGLDVVLTKPVVPSALFDILMQLQRNGDVEAAGEVPRRPQQRFDNARVLVAEDNALNQEVAEQFLIGLGVHVTLANNGLEAVECAARERFDLVLMDMHMPVMDGVTAAKQIFGVPVVAMTAAVSNEDRVLCKNAGMVGFVAKPVDPDELVNLLRRWLPMSTAPATAPATLQVDAAPPFVFEGFDGVAALRRLHGDRAQLMRLLASFAATQGDACIRLQAMLDAEDLCAARDALHALKGTSATLGLMAISRHATALERSLKGGDTRLSTEGLKQAVEAAVAAIEAHGITPRDPQQSFLTLDKAAASQLLRALRRYVHEQELIPDVLIDELKNMATIGAAGNPMQALLQHVLDFDNASAITDIESLLESLGSEP